MSSLSKKDNHIKKGAEILLKGGKMLDKACPNCSLPLYQYKNSVMCVQCEQDYQFITTTKNKIEFDEKTAFTTNATNVAFRSNKQVLSEPPPAFIVESEQILSEKIRYINKLLKETFELEKINELTVVLKTLVTTWKKLHS